jgi:methanogenic corrinoid protein MtbC1
MMVGLAQKVVQSVGAGQSAEPGEERYLNQCQFRGFDSAESPVSAVSSQAAASFRQHLPAILALVGDTLRPKAGGASPAISADHFHFVEDALQYFGDTLAAVYDLALHQSLAEESREWTMAFRSRGLDAGFFRRMMQAWTLALYAIIPTPLANELVPTLNWLAVRADELFATSPVGRDYMPEHARFTQTLMDNRKDRALEIVHAYAGDHSLEGIISGLFLASISDAGVRWRENRLTVAEEHVITANLLWVAHQFYGERIREHAHNDLVAVTCVPGDTHALVAELLAGYLECKGWRVLFLGASMPEEELVRALDTRTPRALVVSVRMIAFLPAFRSLTQLLRVRQPGLTILAGGTPRAKPVLVQMCDGVPETFAECHEMLMERIDHA